MLTLADRVRTARRFERGVSGEEWHDGPRGKFARFSPQVMAGDGLVDGWIVAESGVPAR